MPVGGGKAVLGAIGTLVGVGGEVVPEPTALTKIGGTALIVVSADFFVEGISQVSGKGGAGGISLIQEGAGAYGFWVNGEEGEASARYWTGWAQIMIGLSGGLRPSKIGNVKLSAKGWRSTVKGLLEAGIDDYSSIKNLLRNPSKVFKGAYKRWRKERATLESSSGSSSTLTGGAARSAKYSKDWAKASLKKAISRHAGKKHTTWLTKTGKRIYENPSTGRQVVYDLKGKYFRIYQPKKFGGSKGSYLDMLGNLPSRIRPVGSGVIKQVPLQGNELQQFTHFIAE